MNQLERLAEYRKKTSPMAEVFKHIELMKGDKGDKGDQGDKGDKGDQGIPGRNGLDGARGEKGDRGPSGRNGIDGKDGKDGKNGKDGIAPGPQTIIDAVLRELTAGELLTPEHVGIKQEDIKSIRDLVKFLKMGGFRGGAGTPSTSTVTTPFAETVSGTIDGVNKVFTVPTTIVIPQALYLANSVYQPVVDFTTSGTTITMTVAPDASLSGQPFWLLHT